MRGKLVVFEGLDRAGKSTQCARLVEKLEQNGHKVRHMRFPDRTTPIGQVIDKYLKEQADQEDHVIHLLFTANRWEASASVRSAVESGETVVIDRYYYSGCVYSAAKGNPSLDLVWARRPEVGLPRPDICIFLDISTDAAAKRGGFGEEKYETTGMQKRVQELFEAMRNSADKDDFVSIDAGKPAEEVSGAVWKAISAAFERVDTSGAPLGVVESW
ncbi:thymidylate kinase [Trichodelitschia bisporula]|uniref:Thymidylate kinase n=1 Tax=Trichodelitschia bisporula TaxID=703511 RepID=A0A6G1IAT5_9PEZI|nr:thymidylate kinase [Trichodelitschia bisporula]